MCEIEPLQNFLLYNIMVYLSDCAHILFQSADARRALPCWDEPAFKAIFDVVLVVPKDRVALSNMVW